MIASLCQEIAWSADRLSCRSGLSGGLTEGGDETCLAELRNDRTPEGLPPDEVIQLADT